MKQKKMLTLTFSQLKQIYNQEIPEVVEMADKSSSVEEFKLKMQRFLETCRMENKTAKEATHPHTSMYSQQAVPSVAAMPQSS